MASNVPPYVMDPAQRRAVRPITGPGTTRRELDGIERVRLRRAQQLAQDPMIGQGPMVMAQVAPTAEDIMVQGLDQPVHPSMQISELAPSTGWKTTYNQRPNATPAREPATRLPVAPQRNVTQPGQPATVAPPVASSPGPGVPDVNVPPGPNPADPNAAAASEGGGDTYSNWLRDALIGLGVGTGFALAPGAARRAAGASRIPPSGVGAARAAGQTPIPPGTVTPSPRMTPRPSASLAANPPPPPGAAVVTPQSPAVIPTPGGRVRTGPPPVALPSAVGTPQPVAPPVAPPVVTPPPGGRGPRPGPPPAPPPPQAAAAQVAPVQTAEEAVAAGLEGAPATKATRTKAQPPAAEKKPKRETQQERTAREKAVRGKGETSKERLADRQRQRANARKGGRSSKAVR